MALQTMPRPASPSRLLFQQWRGGDRSPYALIGGTIEEAVRSSLSPSP
ncbi:MAG: hypothetical protein ACJ8CR_26605 [Roseiflexaceae bacterium]